MKALKLTERKYYKYINGEWITPLLSNNTSYGTITASDGRATAYSIFNGGTITLAYNNTSFYIEWEFPYPVTFNSVTYRPRYVTNANFAMRAFYVDAWQNNDWVNIYTKESISTSSSSYITDDMTEITTTKIRIHPYPYTAGTSAASRIEDVTFSGLVKSYTQESTSSDYDFYEDANTFKTIKTTERKYYKYQDASWTQPTMYSDGVIGYGNFAVGAYSEGAAAYNAINGGTWYGGQVSSMTSWYKLFSRVPLKVTQVTWHNNGSAYYNILEATFEGSNDNENWTVLGEINDSVNTANALRTITVSSPDYYKYYRWNITKISKNSNGYTRAGCMIDIQITATQRIITNGTSSDYDFYENIDVYKALAE